MASDEDSVVIPPCRIVTTGVQGTIVSASPLTDALADSGQTAAWGAQHVGFNHFAQGQHHAVVEQAGTASALHPAHNAAHAGMQRQRLSLDLGGIVPPGSGHGLAGRTSSATADTAAQPIDDAQHGAALSPQCMAGMTQGRHPALGRLCSAEPGDAAKQEAEDGSVAGEQDGDDEAARQAAMQQASDPTTNTRLVTGSEVILQNALLDVITAPGAAAMEVTQLFTFWRPQNECKSAKLRHLTHKQHDILYAVSGCSDVKFRIGNLNEAVRRALHDLYGITIQGNTSDLQVWYKNRGNKEKSQAKAAAAAAAAAASGGTVRRRRAAGFASAAAGPGSASGLAVRKTVKRGEPHLSPSSPAAAALLEGAAAAAAAAAGAGPVQAQRAVSVSGALGSGGGVADGHHRQLSAELLGGTAAKRHSTELLMRLQHARGSADALCGGRSGGGGGPASQPHQSAEFFAGQMHEALRSASERPRSQGLSAGLQAYSQQQHRSAAAGGSGRSGRDAAVGLIDRMRSAPPWQSPDARRALGQDFRAASASDQYPWIGAGHERALSAGGEQAGWLGLAHDRAASAGAEQVGWGAMLRDEQAGAAAGAERIGWGALAQERAAASAAAGGDAHIGWGAVGHVCSGSEGVEHLGWSAAAQERAAAVAAAGPEVMDWGNAMAEAAHQYDMQQQQQQQPGYGQQLFDQQHLQQYEQELYYRQQQQPQQEQGLQLQQGASGADAGSFGSIFASVARQQEQGLQLQRAASEAEAGSLGSIFASQARQQDGADAGSFGSIFASVARQQEQGLQLQRAASAADAGSFGSIFASVARQQEVYDEALRAQALSPPPQPLLYCGGSRDAGHLLSSTDHASGSGHLRNRLGHASGSGQLLSSRGRECNGGRHAVGGGGGLGSGRHSLAEELSLSGMEVTAAATAAQEALFSRLSSGSIGGRVGQPAPPQDAGLGFGAGAPGVGVGTAATAAGRRSSRSSPLPGSTSADGVVAAATQGLIKVEDLHSEQPRVLLRQWMEHKAALAAAAAAEAAAGGSGRPSSTNSGGSGSHSQGRLAYSSHTSAAEQHFEHVGNFSRASSIGQAASDQRPMASPFEIDLGVPRHSAGELMQQQVMQAADARAALPAAAAAAATNAPAVLAQLQQQQAPQRLMSAPSLGCASRQPSCGPEALPFPSPFHPPDSLAHAVGATPPPGLPCDRTGLLAPAEDDRLQLTTSFSGGAEALLPSPGGGLQHTSPFSIRGPSQPGAGGCTLPSVAGSTLQLAGGTLQSAAGSTLQPAAAGALQGASPFLAMDGGAGAGGGSVGGGGGGGDLPPASLPGLPRSPQKQKRPLGLADLIAPPTSHGARPRPPSAGEVTPQAGAVDPVPPSAPNPTPITGAPSFKDYLSTWISVGSQMPSIPSKQQRLVPAGAAAAVGVRGRGGTGAHDSGAGPRPMEGMTSGLFEGSTDLELMNAQLREFERQQRHGGAAATAAAAAHSGGGAGGPGRGMLPPPNRAPQPGAVAAADAAGPDLSPPGIAAGVGPTGNTGAVEELPEAVADGDNPDSGLTLSSSMSLSLSLSLTLSLQDAPKSGPLSNSLSTPKSGPLSGAVSMQEAPKSGPMPSVALQEAPRSGGLSAPPSGDWMQVV